MTELYARSMRELSGIENYNDEVYEELLKLGSPVTKANTYVARMRTKYCLEDYEGAYADVCVSFFYGELTVI
jgi:hypothetical protein